MMSHAIRIHSTMQLIVLIAILLFQGALGGRPFHDSMSTNLSKAHETDQPILLYQDDIEMLTALVLYRSYVMLDAPSRLDTSEANLDKFLDFMVMKRRGAGGRIRPLFKQGLKEREMGCARLPPDVQPLCSMVSSSCLSSSQILSLLPMDRLDSLPRALVRLCPLFLFRQRRPLCEHPAHTNADQENTIRHQPALLEPSLERVWAFSILFLTISIVVSMGGLMFLPFVKREPRKIILTFCEGLAVGGLTASAVLHLFPQAFSIQFKLRTYFVRLLLIFGGVHSFYLLERILHLIGLYRARNAPRRPRRGSARDDDAFNLQVIARSARQRLTASERRLNELLATTDGRVRTGSGHAMATLATIGNYSPRESKRTISAGEATPKLLMDLHLASLSAPPRLALEPPMMTMMGSPGGGGTTSGSYAALAGIGTSRCNSVQYRRNNSFFQSEPHLEKLSKRHLVHDVAGRRLDQGSSTRMNIDSVAWMIVLGDASLNFIDGLSIGAAFERSILAGISISVAVMLEEVTHRLGTFAVLIRAGMKMKQSFLWIFVSACALYPGMVVGIFLGDMTEHASPYIFALAGGMFLYMALVDVMNEMNRSVEAAARKSIRNAVKILALQNAGIVMSVFILSMLALFEDEMDFEAVEIQELRDNTILS